MSSTYLLLFYEFFKIGLFSVGGGYATLPFLYFISDKYHWYSHSDLNMMLSISSVTPGPIGINMATFAGFTTKGFIGSVIATSAIVLPAFLTVIFIYEFKKKFCDNFYVKSILYGIKPAGSAMILAVGLKIIYTHIFINTEIGFKNLFSLQNINHFALVLIIFFTFLSLALKKNPLIFLSIAILIGIIKHFL